MTDGKSRNVYIDNVKALLIILVVVGHFTDLAVDESEMMKSLFVFIYSFHMPLFIFVNGLLCKHIVKDRHRVMDKVAVFMALYVALKGILFFTRTVIGHEDISFHLFEEDGVPWYLFSTAVFYVVTYLFRNFNKKWLLVLSVVLALLVGYDPDIGDSLVLSRSIVFYPFFLLGWCIDPEKLSRMTEKIYVKIVCAAAGIVFALLCIFRLDLIYPLRPLFTGRNGYKELEECEPYGLLLRLVCYCISLIMCFIILGITMHREIKVFTVIGRRTLAVYFFHRPILYLLTYSNVLAWLQESAGWTLGNILWLIIAVLLSLMLSASIFSRVIQFFINFRKTPKPEKLRR